MKDKELRSKLSRLQTRAYNLHADLSNLLRELDLEKNNEKTNKN